MITYYELGANKRLNQIVFAGSHDAGITGGNSNVKTQGLDILKQSWAGIRLFDIRIAAQSSAGPSGFRKAELRAFHSGIKRDKVKLRDYQGRGELIERSKLVGGDWGMGLTKILSDARDFVRSESGKNEFLILKFDKCKNWPLIAQACAGVLGNTAYRQSGNINTKTLHDLKGKVVVLFSQAGWTVAGSPPPSQGILRFKNLHAEGQTYEADFDGLQYFGKGGTSVKKPFRKIKQNVSKQKKLMDQAGTMAMANPDLMGMMYWTTTGIFESIKRRNDGMWDAPNVVRLKKLWAGGLQEFVHHRNPLTAPAGSPAVGAERRRYLPNIVMIDFADESKCRHIRGLNDATTEQLAAMADA